MGKKYHMQVYRNISHLNSISNSRMKADEDKICFGAGVETTSIVEKGIWDDLFLLEGGGHVHMKLQFVLSEEERDRIRMMVLFLFPNSHFNECVYGQPVYLMMFYLEL